MDTPIVALWDIYKQAFPPDERRSFTQLIDSLNPPNNAQLTTMIENDTLIGFIISWQLCDFVFVEHLAISSFFRGQGFGTKMLEAFIGNTVQPIVLEVELPMTATSQRRIEFYTKLGFRLHSVPYQQPPYTSFQQPVELLLMSRGDIDLEKKYDTIVKQIYDHVYNFKPCV